MERTELCPKCRGTGERPGGTVYRPTHLVIPSRRCRRCRGTGLI